MMNALSAMALVTLSAALEAAGFGYSIGTWFYILLGLYAAAMGFTDFVMKVKMIYL